MTDTRINGGADCTTHYFVAVVHGSTCRTLKLHASAIWLGCGLLLLTALWAAGSALYLGFHDDLVASLVAHEARMQYAYEDRIAALRTQVDREASRNLASRGSFEGQLRSLSQRATSLETRATLLGQLADRAGVTPPAGRMTSPDARANQDDATGSIEPTQAAPLRSAEKPHPETDPAPALSGHDERASLDMRLADVTAGLEQADAAQYRHLATIAERSRRSSAAVREALSEAGLSPERFEKAAPEADVGGPFVPLDDGVASSPFGQALQALETDVTEAERLRRAVPHVPFASPVVGAAEVTSPFGPRLDPFLGRPALHTGVDLRENSGAQVRVTADGTVVSAGPAGGYGNMVEVDHGDGLTTRYAHLSVIEVAPGQPVTRGQVIAEVGSTGRATGPHLHYETRIDGEPVNPMRFLEAGQHLAALQPNGG